MAKLLRLIRKHEKGVLSLVLLLVFVSGYYSLGFYLNNMAFKLSAVRLFTSIDYAIPFVPAFIIFYFSLYIFAALPYFFVHEGRDFRQVVKAYGFTLIFSFLIFAVFPVEMVRPEVEATNLFTRLTTALYAVDVPYNNFPSLHVSLAFLSAMTVSRFNRKSSFFVFTWAGLIAASTLFVKQHYFLDVIGGLIVTGIGYYLFFRKSSLPHPEKQTSAK